MNIGPIASYLRTLRRRSGLSQRQLAEILGSVSAAQVSRHERGVSIPNLLTALEYEAIFLTPISEMFPGLFHAVKDGVDERLQILEDRLNHESAGDGGASNTARALEWCCERRTS
jgi:transcriptional regulator with XRE-family HTH domain